LEHVRHVKNASRFGKRCQVGLIDPVAEGTGKGSLGGGYMAIDVKSDIEIARAARKRPILEIGAKLGIPAESLEPYGHDKAKVTADFIASLADRPDGKLILVTAISPTPAGEGK